MSDTDLVFHLLDIQARDIRIESEQEDVREVIYESNSDDDDDEIKSKRKIKKSKQLNQQREFVIHLFGATESGQVVRCDVTGFCPTFYIRLPEEKTKAAVEEIKKYIQSQGIPMNQLTFTRLTKKIFYGFTANTPYPFLQIEVLSLSMFRTLRNLFLDDQLRFTTKMALDGVLRGKTIEIFEANIDPMLRFLHTQNIQPCGWVTITNTKNYIVTQDEKSLVIECDYTQVIPTKGPRVSAPFLTASWDIECFSMTGDFPLAKRTWAKTAKELVNLATSGEQLIDLLVNSLSTGQNPVDTLPNGMTPIYCTFKPRAGLKEVYAKLIKEDYSIILKDEDGIAMLEKLLGKVLHSLVYLMGDPVIQIGTTLTRGMPNDMDRHIFVFPDCAPIPGIVVHAYPTEEKMILAWFKWMIGLNPDILIGYNVFGFDESYLWYRAEELGLLRGQSLIHEFTRLFELSSEMKLEEKFLSSSAMGDNRMYIWTTHGRLQVDMFHYIKRNNVLPSYKLDEVTKHFMSGKLKRQSYDCSTQILTLHVAGAIKDVKPGRSIMLLDETGETVSPKLCINSVQEGVITFICNLDEDALTEMDDACKWVIVKDDVSPQDIFRLHRGSAEDRAVVGKYCFPEEDHQILTNHGYMFLYELLERWGDNINGEPMDKTLLIAGFNSVTKELIYERPKCLILNEYADNQDMVEFTQSSYKQHWNKDNIYGIYTREKIPQESDNYTYKVPNFVSIITTPHHDMYARCGVATGDKHQYVIMTRGKARTPIPYEKIKAIDLVGESAPTAIKLLSRIENGISTNNDTSTIYPFTNESGLHLDTYEKQKAFLELYGYWLGDGSILVKDNKMSSITFNIVKEQDVTWLKYIFEILSIKNVTFYKNKKEYENSNTSENTYNIPRQSQYNIKIHDEAYKNLFFNEYSAKYINHHDTFAKNVADIFANVANRILHNEDISEVDTRTSVHRTIGVFENEHIKSAKWMMSWVWLLNKDYSRAIIDGLVRADGSHSHGKALKHIFTSSARFRDEIERLALHAGYSPYSTIGYLAGTVRGYYNNTPIIANHTSWIVNFPENKQFSEPTLKRKEGDIRLIKYSGRTWCVSMPSTFVVVRRAKCIHGVISHASRPVVLGNCLQDCDLVIDLYRKLETFNNSMSMANVCSVPVSYIFTRGQGIKIESLIFKYCRERDIVIPVLPIPKQGGSEDSYEGAIVLDPEPGFYATSPVGVCDFASLYPSTIVSENISHDSLLWIKDFKNDGTLISHNWGSEAYDECDGYAYTDIEFDIIRPDPNDMRKHPIKVKCGRRICRYAQPLDGSKSTLPQITTWLLTARSIKKKEMKAEKDPDRYALLDAEQLAYKLTGNSLYGQLGSGTFKIRLQALAASVTSYGRKQILFAKDAIELFYGPAAKDPRCSARCMAKVVYGDSVTGDTPLVLKDDVTGNIFIKRIDEIYSEDTWNIYHTTKESIHLTNVSVWTETGFTKIHRLIRHKLDPEKNIFRIHTHTGVVDVTEDHSLVLKDGTEAKPTDVSIGTELLHNDDLYKEFTDMNSINTITEDEAFVMGLFVADGSSDVYNCPSGKKASWAINKSDIGLLVNAMNKCPFNTKILNTIESSGVFKLVPIGDITTIASYYRALFYNAHREKRIPNEILNAPHNIIESFWNGFYAGDGDKDNNGYVRFDQKGKEIGAGLYIIARRLGYNVSINDRSDKESIFRYTMTKKTQRKSECAIKKYRKLTHPGDIYVYDLETDNHHFGVGPGALIVHNTDSLFVEFNPRNPETGDRLEGREARQATIDITGEAGHFITKVLAAPHDFEFDKAFDPLLMFSKKRYAGNMYEENADDYVHKYMGIALKRRDNAPIVKTIFGGAMKMLLDKRDVMGAFKFVKDKCLELVDGKVSLGQLTVTKSLRADYANPLSIAHKVLADRITTRDPGNAPAAGDRIGYVYISPKSGQLASKLQGDRIETPLFIKDNKLVPDYKHYIEHQLQNPISQAFGLLLEQIPGFKMSMVNGCPTIQEDLDKYLAFREAKAAELLFSDCLKKFEKISTTNAITHMFKGSVVITKTPLKYNIGSSGTNVISASSATSIISASSASSAISASSASSASSITSDTSLKKKPVQKIISAYLLDAHIINSMKKNDRDKANAIKADALKADALKTDATDATDTKNTIKAKTPRVKKPVKAVK